MAQDIVVTGGTGYIGGRLVRALLAAGMAPRVLARTESASRIPGGATALIGDALDADSIVRFLTPATVLVHLVGTPHPSPAKAAQFVSVDLASIRASVAAASRVRIAHLVYVSVAHPAPAMHAYVEARMEGERAIVASGLSATVLRPWYVLGPGHRWPVVLVPFYALAEHVPALRASALRLGLVTIDEMVAALAGVVTGTPPEGVTVLDVPAIRSAARAASTSTRGPHGGARQLHSIGSR